MKKIILLLLTVLFLTVNVAIAAINISNSRGHLKPSNSSIC